MRATNDAALAALRRAEEAIGGNLVWLSDLRPRIGKADRERFDTYYAELEFAWRDICRVPGVVEPPAAGTWKRDGFHPRDVRELSLESIEALDAERRAEDAEGAR